MGVKGRGIRAHLPAKGSSTHGCRADQRTAAAPTHSITAVQLNLEPIQLRVQSPHAPWLISAAQRSRTEARRCEIVVSREARVLNIAF
jgi:hypothetical protein